MSKLPYQPVLPLKILEKLDQTLRNFWGEIARAHNASVQPRWVELTGDPPEVLPEMEQYELIFLSCPEWGVGRQFLVYFDGTYRFYFETTDIDLIVEP